MFKNEQMNWMWVIFGPSGTTALKTDRILPWTSLHGLRKPEEAICEHDPETLPSSLDQSSSKNVWGEMENSSVVKWIKI